MSMYKSYKTDEQLEKNGIRVLFAEDEICLTLARAGGQNAGFQKALAANLKPYRRALQSETLSDKKANELLMKTFAESVVLRWETRAEDGTYREGIEVEGKTELQPVTVENMVAVFQALPDLFEDIKAEASRLSNYRKVEREEDAKNSQSS